MENVCKPLELILRDGTKVLFSWESARIVVPNPWHIEIQGGVSRVRTSSKKLNRGYLHNLIARDKGYKCATTKNRNHLDCRIENLYFSFAKHRQTAANHVIKNDDGTISIQLNDEAYAIVDAADYPTVEPYRWHALTDTNGTYAVSRSLDRKTVMMHRLIVGEVPSGFEVDHQNNIRHDNRRSNLRLASRSQNAANAGRKKAEGYKGVHWDKVNKKWEVRLKADGKGHYIGRFTDEVEAAKAYDTAARKHHGEFAKLNFPEEGK